MKIFSKIVFLAWLLSALVGCDDSRLVQVPSLQSNVTAGPPTVQIAANGFLDHTSVSSGAPVNLLWTSLNATQCSISAQAGIGALAQPQSWGNTLTGSHRLTISSEMIFVAVCQNSKGQTASSQVDVTVNPASPSVLITANGQTGQLAVSSGATAKIAWSSQNATQCQVTAQAGSTGTPQVQTWGNLLSGSQTLAFSTDTIFVATCQNASGVSASSQVEVFVSALAPTVTISANGKTGLVPVTTGGVVAVAWYSANASSCQITAQAGPAGIPQPQSWGALLSGSHSLAISSETIFVATCQNSQGASVSSRVDVTVAGPAPTVTLTANGNSGQLTVPSNSAVQIAWSSENAAECEITAQVEPSGSAATQSWGNALSGSHSVSLSTETLFVATCQNAAGATGTSQVDVSVSTAGPTAQVAANGQTGQVTVPTGSNVAIQWTSQNATQCQIAATPFAGTPQNETWGTTTSGSQNVVLSVETVFALTCRNASGATASSQVDVKISQPVLPPSVSITANGVSNKISVPVGTTVTIGWTSQNANQCQIAAQAGSSGAPQPQSWGDALSGSHGVSIPNELIFVATCLGAGGTSATSQVDVVATAPSPSVVITANGVANHIVVTSGMTVQLAWSSQNATQCGITAQAGPSGTPARQSWGNSLGGSYSEVPTTETIFTATCANALGVTATSSVDVLVAPPCNGGGKTIIQLLTSQIVNNAPNQYMRYNLSYEDCNGVAAPVPSGVLWYDDAATFENGIDDRPYQVSTTDGSVNVGGTFKTVWGEDLFGNQSNFWHKYFHYETDQAIALPSGTMSIQVSIDMSDIEIHAYQTDINNLPPLEPINTFLRMGDSQPDVATVTFKNNQ